MPCRHTVTVSEAKEDNSFLSPKHCFKNLIRTRIMGLNRTWVWYSSCFQFKNVLKIKNALKEWELKMVIHLWITRWITCSCPTSDFTFVLHQMPSFQSHRPEDAHSEFVKSIWHDGSGYGLSKSTDVHAY